MVNKCLACNLCQSPSQRVAKSYLIHKKNDQLSICQGAKFARCSSDTAGDRIPLFKIVTTSFTKSCKYKWL